MKYLSVSFMFFIVLVSSCICEENNEKYVPVIENQYLDLLYIKSIKDAMNPTIEEIDSSLALISNAKFRLKDEKGNTFIKVVTLVNQKNAAKYSSAISKKDSIYKIEGFNVWVTLAPEIKDYFQKKERYENINLLKLRTKQLLGLHYKDTYSHFVELWVPEKNLMRPCPNYDPNVAPCTLNFEELETDNDTVLKYREWFNKKRFSTYVETEKSKAFPFTQLGYTYDWGDLGDEVGLTEFVVLGKIWPTDVYISKVETIEAYLTI